MPRVVIFITAGLLLLAVFPLPIGYYTLLRIIATGTFAWGAICAFKQNSASSLTWIYVLIGIIFNPIIPIFLPKTIWILIDIASACFLVATKKSTVGKFNE